MINLIYFGTSDHSVILLNAIKNNPEAKLKLVVTKPDKKVGTDREITPTPVKKWCIENDIPFITPASLKKEAENVLTELKKHENEENLVGLVADYGLMIPTSIIDFFKNGLINIHFSLLPKYRGASPVTYTILNGDKVTGISFLFVTPEMDKGDIIKQIPFEITENETDETLYKKLFTFAGEDVVKVIGDLLEKRLTTQKQNEDGATYTTPFGKFDRTTYILKEDAKIDWNKTPEEIERAVRAYNPWPIAWSTLLELSQYLKTTLRNEENSQLKVKIYKAHLEENNLKIDEIQIEGKNKIDFKSFENGYLIKQQ